MWGILFFVGWLAMLAVSILVALLGWAFVAMVFWFVWVVMNGTIVIP
ncbi:hypothetical protein TPMD04_39 [Thiohalocapsa phage LS06-2018-MD04]|jgi:hypothetical protein|nr:hypothetical protein TPMD04_39 [Thiohalocapsa phage LS06-2018-MD04]